MNRKQIKCAENQPLMSKQNADIQPKELRILTENEIRTLAYSNVEEYVPKTPSWVTMNNLKVLADKFGESGKAVGSTIGWVTFALILSIVSFTLSIIFGFFKGAASLIMSSKSDNECQDNECQESVKTITNNITINN